MKSTKHLLYCDCCGNDPFDWHKSLGSAYAEARSTGWDVNVATDVVICNHCTELVAA